MTRILVHACIERAELYLEWQEFEKAKADIEKGLLLDPRHFRAFILKGNLYFELAMYSHSIEQYDLVSSIDIHTPLYRYTSGKYPLSQETVMITSKMCVVCPRNLAYVYLDRALNEQRLFESSSSSYVCANRKS